MVAFFWHAIVEDSNDVWRAGPEISWATLLWTPLIGVAFGLAVVVAFRWLEPRQPWISELGGEFRSIFGRPRLR
ncbi:MAG: hypothetical protein KC468_14355, partial [Myxococcales bacterium]|nr:hypothetical protein [Myxococcales bacterium]